MDSGSTHDNMDYCEHLLKVASDDNAVYSYYFMNDSNNEVCILKCLATNPRIELNQT